MRLWAILALLPGAGGDEYLPLREGSKLAYVVEERGADQGAATTEAVAEVGGADASGWVRVDAFLGYERCFVRSTASGVELKAAEAEEAPVLRILKLPATAGDEWTGTLGRDEVKFTMRGDSEVETAAGRIRALHVEFGVAAPGKHAGHAATRGELWFSRGVGLVRAQVTKDLDCHSAESRVWTLK
jgi:hypothetical protein